MATYNWKNGEYIITPYIVELMKRKENFAAFYEDGLVLVSDEYDQWYEGHHGVSDDYPRMMAKHITDRKGYSGYVLHDMRVLVDLTIPDEMITDYESVVKLFEEDELKIADISSKVRKCSVCKHRAWNSYYGIESCMWYEMTTTDEEETSTAAGCFKFEEGTPPCLEEDEYYTPSATAGDYSPSCPWKAPGMSVRDFI